MRTLIAEDEAVSRRLLEEALKSWGHEVLVTEDGAQAWQVLQRGDVHLVIADWVMPHLDGLELCRKVREAHLDRYVYIILLTARGRKRGQGER